jgi:hypothetical protein
LDIGVFVERVGGPQTRGNRGTGGCIVAGKERTGGNIYLDIGCDYRVRGIWYRGWHSHRFPPLKSQKRVKLVSVCASHNKSGKQEVKKESGGVVM